MASNQHRMDDLISSLMRMDIAIKQRKREEVEQKKQELTALFQAHPQVVNTMYGGMTVVDIALFYEFEPELIQFLLEHGAHPDIEDEHTDIEYEQVGLTPLMRVVKQQNIPMIRLLLTYGADPEFQNKNGRSAMDIAQESGNQEIIALLSSSLHLEKNKNKGRSQNQLNRNHRNNLQKTTVNGGKRRKSRHHRNRKHRRRTTIRRSKTHRRRRY